LVNAIVWAAKEKNMPQSVVTNFDAPTGKGVTGTVNGHLVVIGNVKLLQELDAKNNDLFPQADNLREKGATVIGADN